jgi:hypothetical protein
MIQLNSPFIGTLFHAGATIPALFRKQHYGRLPFLRIRDHDVDLADINAFKASVTEFGIE